MAEEAPAGQSVSRLMRISKLSPWGGWRSRLLAGRRRFTSSRRTGLLALAGMLLAGAIVSAVLGGAAPDSTAGKTRMDWFRDAAPASVGFFQSLWGSNDAGEPALELMTDEVREQFFRGIPFGEIIHAKAEKYEVDPVLVAAIVEVESAFEIHARSSRGAVGLMQLRPATGRWMGARNLSDPGQNIDAGTRYLKYLEERFDGDLRAQLAAYNAGEGTVRRYGGVPPFPETRSYIRKVLDRYERRSLELEQFHRSQLEKTPRRD